jgi:hypothetical protein
MSFQREDRTIKRERKSISIPKNRRRRQKKQKQSGNAIYEYVKQGESKCSVSDGMGVINNDDNKLEDNTEEEEEEEEQEEDENYRLICENTRILMEEPKSIDIWIYEQAYHNGRDKYNVKNMTISRAWEELQLEKNKDCPGFTYNCKIKTCYFHTEIENSRICTEKHKRMNIFKDERSKNSTKHKWHLLITKQPTNAMCRNVTHIAQI